MNWDYEILNEQTVLDLSYRTVRERLYTDIERIGFKEAMLKAEKNFDIAISQLEGCNQSNVFEKCDGSYRILLSTYTAMLDAVWDNVYHFRAFAGLNLRLNFGSGFKEEMARIIKCFELIEQGKTEKEITKLGFYTEYYNIKPINRDFIRNDIMYCSFFANFKNNKSITELFTESLDAIIQTYCHYQVDNKKQGSFLEILRGRGKDWKLQRIRGRMLNEAINFILGVMKKEDRVMSIVQAVNNIIFSREVKFNTPFEYFEERGW